MPALAPALGRLIRDPRVRVLVVVLLILLAFALAWHLVGMGEHSMMIGSCLAVLAIAGAMRLVDRVRAIQAFIPVGFSRAIPNPGIPAPRTGRPPPEHGTILRP